jgi:LAO/AO transport system kinase
MGLTGPPGSGKSTLVDGLISELRGRGETVAVMAIDPSSPRSGGAILGDRVRMQRHAGDAGVYIRSMGSRGHLGGLAASSGAVVELLRDFGFDWILVETVGVGQSEVEIASHADTTVVVMAPGMGDGIQALKAGILEIADVLVVNKADLPGAEQTRRDLRAMLQIGPRGLWKVPLICTRSDRPETAADLLEAVEKHRRHIQGSVNQVSDSV